MNIDNKIRDILRDIPEKTVREEIELSLVISTDGTIGGMIVVSIPFGTTAYMAKRIEERYGGAIIRFDIDAYNVNNFGGKFASDKRSYYWDYEEFDQISHDLLYGKYVFYE